MNSECWRASVAFVLLVSIFSGCGYSRWGYRAITPACKDTQIELEYGFAYAGIKPVSEGRDWSDTTFFYTVVMTELDTTGDKRFTLEVKNVVLKNLRGKPETVLPLAEFGSKKVEYVAPSVLHIARFGPFDVTLPRPDTVYVEQDISILDGKTGEVLRQYHQNVRGILAESRGSRIVDFINGT